MSEQAIFFPQEKLGKNMKICARHKKKQIWLINKYILPRSLKSPIIKYGVCFKWIRLSIRDYISTLKDNLLRAVDKFNRSAPFDPSPIIFFFLVFLIQNKITLPTGLADLEKWNLKCIKSESNTSSHGFEILVVSTFFSYGLYL